MTTPEPVISFRDVSKSYGGTPAVADVSFDVFGGEVLGLLGPNGAGKTTLIRILMDIIRADRGTVLYRGEPMRRKYLDRFGYLPEERGLYVKQKVLDVLTYFAALKGLSRREAIGRSHRWLERIGLPEVAGWKVERLSKGMSQKVQIVSALLADPEVAILDEPFSGLDPVNVRLVKDLIRERKDSGATTILSTHQMNMVEELCDRVAMIHRGRLVLYGEVGDIRRRHSPPEVRIALEGELPPLDGVAEVRPEGDHTWRIRLRDTGDGARILQQLVATGAEVYRYERVLAPMEDIFIALVGGEGR
ncbi:MAG: ATP-binding cassette domain-containing protein [Acidobacteria bacterium]|nr:MAG: ATP-binding cassette domain-containing protein [Acidobacteriota bacterium]